ncbi:MAG: c-type cytochrome [Acidimicrobiia bacterium]|nr:c-type cytochrome [Acidimicrobiia bacterium]
MRKWLLLLGILLAGCSYGTTSAPHRPPSDVMGPETRGPVLYARDCAWCHGSNGEGTARGPNLNGDLDGGAYTHFMLSTGRMPLSSPTARAQRRTAVLTPTQIDAVIEHVKTFGGTGPDIPKVEPTTGHLGTGSELYLSNCAACHSATGTGGALTSRRAAPHLTNPDITPVQMAEAMLVGPGCRNNDSTCGFGSGAMPNFDFSETEVNSITAYVSYLQHGGDHGGFAIGRIGPVAEGAVGWIIGLGSILLIGRWVGTRMGDNE